MSEDVQYQANWSDENTQCKHCKNFQAKDGRAACVPPDKTFEQAVKEYGEMDPNGHCNYFESVS